MEEIYTKSVKKAGYCIYKLRVMPVVVNDRQNRSLNAFYFRNNSEELKQTVMEYKDKIEKQEKLVDDRDIYIYEQIIGQLKK